VPKSRSSRRPTGSRPRATRRPVVAQPAPGARGRAERASAPALLWLSAKPAFVLPVLTVVLLVVGLAAPAVIGVPVLLLLAALVGWLSYLSWPVVQGVQRLLRLGTVVLLLVAVVGRVAG